MKDIQNGENKMTPKEYLTLQPFYRRMAKNNRVKIHKAIDIALKEQADKIFKELRNNLKDTDLKFVFEKRLKLLEKKYLKSIKEKIED